MSPLIVVPDCNVLIHGRSLHEIPWETFGADAIEIRIVGQVVSEIDSVKNRAGRPSRIARDISSQFRTLLDAPDQTEVICETGPRVTRRLWLGRRETRTATREGLHLGHGDQAIINQVLAMSDAGEQVIILTDDVLAAALARDFGATFKLLPDDWRRPAEQDEAQKEIARLRTENARLQSAEPRFSAWFETRAGEQIERLEATVGIPVALAPEFVDGLMARVARAAPMADLKPPAPSPPRKGSPDLASLREEWGGGIRPVSAQQISKYEEAYRSWLQKIRSLFEQLHVHRTRRREWPEVLFVADNEGERPASHTLVELEARGEIFIERPVRRTGAVKEVEAAQIRSETHLDMPPVPPKPGPREITLSALAIAGLDRPMPSISPALMGIPKGREADAFYWRDSRGEPGDRLEVECASWRHKREPERFRFAINCAPADSVRGAVIATLSADNVSEPLTVTLPVRIGFESAALEEDAERMVQAFERAMARSGAGPAGSPRP
nr:PIN domain-containing protein [uncultured Brevundimonas sp.]